MTDVSIHPEASRDACPFPMARVEPLDAPPAFRELRDREGPAARIKLWDGSQAWLVTRYDEVRQVLSDRRFSSDVRRPGFPTFYEGQRAVIERGPSFIRADPPEHSRLRRMLTRDFMLKHIENLRPQVRSIVDSLIDDLEQGPRPADLVEALALATPSLTVCRFLGIPYSEHRIFQDLTNLALSRSSTPAQIADATADLMDWLEVVVGGQEREPGDGLIGQLVREQLRPGLLSHDDLVAMTRLLVVAGHETTANMLGMTLLSYMQHPELFAGVDRDPVRLKQAVEELLRYHSVIQIGLARVAAQDVDLGGQPIAAGEGVIVSLLSANRDERAYPGPDEITPGRGGPKHVAFGFGVHQCIGQALARVEVQEVLAGVVRRLPGLRLAVGLEELPFRHAMTVHGVHELPATW